MGHYRVMVVDDETPNLESLERILKSDGGEVIAFEDARKALESVRREPVDVLMTDLRMEVMSGMELLDAVKTLDSTIEVIMMTAFGTVELAVEAMKKGAYDFVTKPLQRIQVLRTVHKALEKRGLVNENASLKDELRSHMVSGRCELVGKSAAMKEMMDVADQAARSRANVLIEGESGTGKGLLAEYIHRSGMDSQGLYVKITCTAIPDNLLEAELFGYEAGAFTGALRRKKGRIELAHHGTLFLDEVGIAPPMFQAKLLRFLQEGEFERLGGMESQKVETRVIGATNVDLKSAIASGVFREDLFYRLNVIHITVPPLRERKDDIPLLATKFIEDCARKNGRPVPLLTAEALECLVAYSWPGNIRELQNLMERVVVLDRTGLVKPVNLPVDIGRVERPRSICVPVGASLRAVERMVMSETLRYASGDKRLAARLLGVHPRTISRYLDSQQATEGQSAVAQGSEIGSN